jgi:hypothetical protein
MARPDDMLALPICDPTPKLFLVGEDVPSVYVEIPPGGSFHDKWPRCEKCGPLWDLQALGVDPDGGGYRYSVVCQCTGSHIGDEVVWPFRLMVAMPRWRWEERGWAKPRRMVRSLRQAQSDG